MKKKLLCIILTAALLLGIFVPGTALAAKGPIFEDFNAMGQVGGIDEGDVRAAGNSGRWIVADRHVFGMLDWTDDEIDNGEPFLMTYKANVDSTQTGTFNGDLAVGSLVFKVRGKSAIIDDPVGTYADFPLVGPNPAYPNLSNPYEPPFIFVDEDGNPVAIPVTIPVTFHALKTEGSWTITEGAIGNGSYDGTTIVAINSADHIVGIADMLYMIGFPPPIGEDGPLFSTVVMDGKWKQ